MKFDSIIKGHYDIVELLWRDEAIACQIELVDQRLDVWLQLIKLLLELLFH